MNVGTILLDRDGIINKVVMRDGKVSSPHNVDEFLFAEGIDEFVSRLKEKSISFAIISNQPDVARGLISKYDLESMNNLIRDKLGIEHIFICEHDDNSNCSCRKPKFGLITMAQNNLGFSSESALFVGDGWKDMEAGRRFGIRTVLLRTDYNKSTQGDIVVDNLIELLDYCL